MRLRSIIKTTLIGSMLFFVPVVPAGQQAGNPPGQPTQARVQVTNRGTDEALPVVVQAGGEIQPVAVVSAPVLSLAANTHVSTEARTQRWEYRVVVAKAGEDPVALLDKAGAEGWEAVGLAPTLAAAEMRVLMKRPRQ